MLDVVVKLLVVVPRLEEVDEDEVVVVVGPAIVLVVTEHGPGQESAAGMPTALRRTSRASSAVTPPAAFAS